MNSPIWVKILLLGALILPTDASLRPTRGAKFSITSPWTWTCRESRGCVKTDRADLQEDELHWSLAACKLICNEFSALWPKPRGTIQLSKKLVTFLSTNQLRFINSPAPSKEVEGMLKEAADIFVNRIRLMAEDQSHPKPIDFTENVVQIQLSVVSRETDLEMTTNESYQLMIQTTDKITLVYIVADSFFGARHALETLSQLIAWDDTVENYLLVSDSVITDSPAFVHRGFLVDTSRNFINVATIKKILDGMSYDKLNVFHWHMTDTHSFPFVSKREPLMAVYGAYSPSKVYRPEDVAEIVRYAMVRGIKVVPEFDAPAHVGSGWEWGERYGLGKLALCVNQEPWQDYCVEPPCGQLNPINPNVYKILSNIYKDMADLFRSDIFHMGGDEVHMRCWNETSEILDWLSTKGHVERDQKAFLYLWSHFQNESLAKLDQAHSAQKKPIVLWTSGLTEEGHADRYLDPSRYIIQIWTTASDPQIADLYAKGFKLIMSNYDAWYFDCGFGAWVGNASNNWCSPYIGWQKVYENSPRQIIIDANLTFSDQQVLGGEVAIWSEQVDSATIEGKLWPRASAFAERMWSDPESDWRAAETRLYHHRERLVQRGILADGLQPEWCHQNDGYCFL